MTETKVSDVSADQATGQPPGERECGQPPTAEGKKEARKPVRYSGVFRFCSYVDEVERLADMIEGLRQQIAPWAQSNFSDDSQASLPQGYAIAMSWSLTAAVGSLKDLVGHLKVVRDDEFHAFKTGAKKPPQDITVSNGSGMSEIRNSVNRVASIVGALHTTDTCYRNGGLGGKDKADEFFNGACGIVGGAQYELKHLQKLVTGKPAAA